jgi:hypothetical protein
MIPNRGKISEEARDVWEGKRCDIERGRIAAWRFRIPALDMQMQHRANPRLSSCNIRGSQFCFDE